MTILFSRVVVEDGVVGELSVHVAVVGGGLGPESAVSHWLLISREPSWDPDVILSLLS